MSLLPAQHRLLFPVFLLEPVLLPFSVYTVLEGLGPCLGTGLSPNQWETSTSLAVVMGWEVGTWSKESQPQSTYVRSEIFAGAVREQDSFLWHG